MKLVVLSFWILTMAPLFPTAAHAGECVVLLHGLARSANSLLVMEWRLKRAGYDVVNVDYPSKEATIEDLADRAIPEALEICREAETVHFVTHSMGGILLRYYMERIEAPFERMGRTVMMGPPNHGTPVIDHLNDLPGFEIWNGIAGMQLGTGPESLPNKLGPVDFELGVIAGEQSLNPLLSSVIEGPDDGKVGVASTKVEGMTDHIVMPVTHTFMMNNPNVVEQVLAFLETGAFKR
jgi:pimeloyl-ACP methyl ester carboxylesterase